ncbi:MAG: type VI secretion system tip protein VgrG [Deltaproteobacteria bacterium]|nr:type VI secretion system tip protein VgrG [Deltaproteobacteria bacterium]
MKHLALVVLVLLSPLARAAKPSALPNKQPTVWVRSSLPVQLHVKSFTARSALSRDFNVSATLETSANAFNARRLLGQRLTFGVKLKGGQERIFDGYVLRVQRSDSRIQVTVGPNMALLRKSADLVPFHRLSYPQVVRKVLKRHRFMRARFALQEKHPKRPFTLQYRETDRNFIDRLLEQVGIYYYFEHTRQGHRLVLVDHPKAHRAFVKDARFVVGMTPRGNEQVLQHWSETSKLMPGRYTLMDHDQRVLRPKRMLTSWRDKHLRHPFAKLEIYDFPGEYETIAHGQRLARLRAEEMTSQRVRVSASALDLALVAGYLIDVAVQGKKAQRYLIVSDQVQWSGPSPNDSIQVSFTAIPFSIRYRPQRRTPKPVVQGVQIAKVVSKGDPQGRVRLRFRWARRKSHLSGWVRSAGDLPPPVGSHVLVGFTEGDPDRPLIVGTLLAGAGSAPATRRSNTLAGKKAWRGWR